MESRSRSRSKGTPESEAKSIPPTQRQTASVDSDDGENYNKPAIQYHDVTAAAYRIRKGVKETPLEVRLEAFL